MRVWNIMESGAKADGRTNNARSIQSALDAAGAAGGGRVMIPEGHFLSGPLHLRSKVELHLAQGALLQFSREFAEYPLVLTDYEGLEAIRSISPIWGVDLHDIAITGDGVIDGQGDAWRPVKKFKMTESQWAELVSSGGVVDERHQIWWPTKAAMGGLEIVKKLREAGRTRDLEAHLPVREFLRPNMVKLTRCRNVRLEGVTFQNSAAWNVHLLLCEGVSVSRVTILNPWYSSNGDALDLDSCRNVTVTDSHFDCGDDAICIKSGKDEEGRRRGIPSENITVSHCTVRHGHGGVTIGSEMSGGVRNVRVSNCVFDGTDIGLRFKTTRGRGSVVENIEISNVTMSNIRYDAISLNMYYFVKEPTPEPVSERTPRFRGIHFRNILCDGAARAIEIRGLPEMPIENITLENVRMRTKSGAVVCDARDVLLRDVHLDVSEAPALHCHNVRNLRLDNVNGNGPVEGWNGVLVGDL